MRSILERGHVSRSQSNTLRRGRSEDEEEEASLALEKRDWTTVPESPASEKKDGAPGSSSQRTIPGKMKGERGEREPVTGDVAILWIVAL